MIPYEFNAERFSRWMAYVLRHNPARYGLEPDRHGFVDFEAFLSIARRRYPDVTPDHLKALIGEGARRRFELAGSRIRARYGHSIPVEPAGEPVEPPERLYHGTDAARRDRAMVEGLQPVDRRMVHLSTTIEDALAVARRRTPEPVVLRVAAQTAQRAGLTFYAEEVVYLTAHVPPQFLSVEPLPGLQPQGPLAAPEPERGGE